MPVNPSIVDITATVTATSRISSDVTVICLHCPEIAKRAIPGNFVNIKVNDSTQPLLRRPFSIHRVDGESIAIMAKAIGSGTAILCQSPPGSTMQVLGPLGNGFSPPDSSFATALLVSGGIGTAPMLFLEKTLSASGKHVINIIGGRSSGDLLIQNLSNCRTATDDGTAGFRGTAVDLLRHDLPELLDNGPIKVFSCGPNAMLKALAKFCREQHIACEVSLESVMGCGIGICYGCSIEVNAPDGGTETILLCREGAVINAARLVL
ncbi:MAG: dihydroorotate dehydrogenase electron transfer subunit [Chlorobiaceae bacterium]|jgi:dihydroorotate dehydrogenase electron transfer subunit|nr:dihydroorotate dehydrogenase electron transfer subunit [Chlorobiaceae bacterium]